MSPRRYVQRARAESAAETRERILQAVYAAIRAAPAQAVNVERVAADAGVSRSTVYVIFESRAGLFDAFGEWLFARAGLERLVEAFAHPDPRQRLRDSTHASVGVYAAERDGLRALFSMGLLDPDAVGGAPERFERRRMAGMRRMARDLRLDGALRKGVGERQAFEVLWLTASFDAFDILYTGAGLSARRTAEVLLETSERTLIARPG